MLDLRGGRPPRQIIAQMNYDNPGLFVEVPGVAPCARTAKTSSAAARSQPRGSGRRASSARRRASLHAAARGETLYNATIAIGDSLWARRCSARAHSSSSAAMVRARPDAPRPVRQPVEGRPLQEGEGGQVHARGERPPRLRHPGVREAGTSNHEHGLAVDVSGASAWRKQGRTSATTTSSGLARATRCTSRTTARAASTTAARTSAPSRSSGTPTTSTRSGTRRRMWVLAEPGEEMQPLVTRARHAPRSA